MRKRLITPSPQDAPPLNEVWLDLDDAAVVEVTSEEKGMLQRRVSILARGNRLRLFHHWSAEYGGGQQTESRNLLDSQANSLPLLTFLPDDRHK